MDKSFLGAGSDQKKGWVYFASIYLTILSAMILGITIDRAIISMVPEREQKTGGLLMYSKKAELTAQMNAAVAVRNEADKQAKAAQDKLGELSDFMNRFPSEENSLRLVVNYWTRLYKTQIGVQNDAQRTIDHLQEELLML